MCKNCECHQIQHLYMHVLYENPHMYVYMGHSIGLGQSMSYKSLALKMPIKSIFYIIHEWNTFHKPTYFWLIFSTFTNGDGWQHLYCKVGITICCNRILLGQQGSRVFAFIHQIYPNDNSCQSSLTTVSYALLQIRPAM